MRFSTRLFYSMAALVFFSMQIRAETVLLSPVADTGLFQHNPDNNLGGLDFIPIGTTGTGAKSRGLFKFDIAGNVPAGATVTSATLVFNVVFSSPGADDVNASVYRVLQGWTEGNKSGFGGSNVGAPASAGETTWNNRTHPSTAWASPGGASGLDFASGASASGEMFTSGGAVFSSAQLAADAQLWLTNAAANHGWILILDDEVMTFSARRVASRENAGSAPSLSVEYTMASTPPSPALTLLSATNNQFQFSFEAEANRTYAVETRTSFSTGSWQVLTNFPGLPTPSTRTVTDVIFGQARFYRVKSP